MKSMPSWIWVVLIIALIIAPSALADFFSQLISGFQTAFQGVGG